MAAEPSHTPTVALATPIAISSGVPMRSSAGDHTKMNGSANAGQPSWHARQPTFIGGAWAMCPAAYAAIATGGVIIDRQPKKNTNMCAAIGGTPSFTRGGAASSATSR